MRLNGLSDGLSVSNSRYTAVTITNPIAEPGPDSRSFTFSGHHSPLKNGELITHAPDVAFVWTRACFSCKIQLSHNGQVVSYLAPYMPYIYKAKHILTCK